ncbi:MAG: diaminopimelate epimerase [Gemmatimonadota bacterium]
MVRFTKLTGAGNDFVAAVPGSELDARGSEQARRLCSRRTGVGVDGLILVYPVDGGVRVRFFNPDGSEFSTCGNGTRCAARFAVRRGLVDGGPFDVVTDAGPIEARVDAAADRVSLEYRLPATRRGPIPVEVPGGPTDGWLMHFGVPHFVVPLRAMPEGPIEPFCAPIRSDPRLGPEGANVNLITLHEPGVGRIRTFERGVEGETLACGSGSMAAVIASHAIDRAARRVELEVRGDEVLGIELLDEPVFDGTPIRVRLEGPAVPLFDGEFPGIDDG